MNRIFAIGDLHLGVRNNSVRYLEYQENWFRNNLFPLINKDDHIFFVGDIFDNRTNISTIILNKSEEIFGDLVAKCPNVHILLGNHDIFYRTTRKINSVKFLKNIDCNVYDELTELTINNKKILVLPWITKDEIESISTILVKNKYDLCFGHLEVNGFEVTKGITESNGLSSDLFSNCKKVFSGHYHLRGNNKNIQYIGTPYELDWGDYKSIKGFDIINLDDLTSTFTLSKEIPKHIKLNSSTTKLEDITKELITDNFIQLWFDGSTSEANQIKYQEKINALNPISFTVDNDNTVNDDNIEINTSIKDTLGFLKEYIDLIDVPDNIDKQVLFEKLSEFYNQAQT